MFEDWIDTGIECFRKPPNNKVTCKAHSYGDYTGRHHDGKQFGHDLDSDVHEGFTVGGGKTLYWEMIWHGKSGNVTVYNRNTGAKRYLEGDKEITIHFK